MTEDSSILKAAGRVYRTEGISPRVAGISISAIKEMPILAQEVPGAVSLGQGIPSFRTPKHIRQAVAQALETEDWIGKYSLQPGWPPLKQAVADSLQREIGVRVDPEKELFISTGSMEALFAAIMTVIEPGGEMIMPSPNYASHVEQVLLAGGTVRWAPLIEKDGWRWDMDAVEKAVNDKTRAIILCNPLNPTGAVFSEEDVRGLADVCLKHNLFLITDEAYAHMVYDRPRPFSPLLIPELKNNLIVCAGFSKKYAMTGWRIGYMISSSGVIDQCLKVHDAASIAAPTISQVAAKAALDGPQECVTEMVAQLQQRRDLMCARLEKMAPAFTFIKPDGAYYIFVRFHMPGLGSNDLAIQLLREARVITIPGRSFGPTGDDFIRLSFGGTPEEIDEAMNRIQTWLEQKGYIPA